MAEQHLKILAELMELESATLGAVTQELVDAGYKVTVRKDEVRRGNYVVELHKGTRGHGGSGPSVEEAMFQAWKALRSNRYRRTT
jgi:hypothetical protein